ncbi:hypothetical protein [Haloplanus sp.]|uniref:hypothetical protein n=1 Tax=Haloplanus sp. TaxID=1961696 RepID=UPI00262B8D38|nr:hypothetical protein [Haloplanus sp.]
MSADTSPGVGPGPGPDPDPDEGNAADSDPGLGLKAWVLVAAVVVAVLVVPMGIYLWPAAGGVLGAHYRTAMLVLPLFPAILLGLVAVWSMTVGRSR